MADAEARLELERRKASARLCRCRNSEHLHLQHAAAIACNAFSAFVSCSRSQAKKHSEALEHEVNMLSTYMYTLGR
jgi:hypothetical protein